MAKLIPHFALAEALGRREVVLEASTVEDLLMRGRERFGSPFSAHTRGVSMLVNGQNINQLQGFQTPLSTDDVIWFVLPSAGG